jgi:hypothetical protein
MPYVWVEPEVALDVGSGRKFYRVYDGDGLGGPRNYWFTSHRSGTDFDDPGQFDIRGWIGYDSTCWPAASLATAVARGAFEWRSCAGEWLAGPVEGNWHSPWHAPDGFASGGRVGNGPA